MHVLTGWAGTAMFVVFAVAFVAKARSATVFDDFAASLSQFGVRSIGGQRVLAGVVLVLEVLACVGLAVLAHHPLARFALPVVLLVAFSAGVGWSARGGQLTACHCFGTSTELPAAPHVVLNAALAVLGLLAGVGGDPGGTVGDTVLGVGLGVICGVLFVCSADLYIALSTGQRAVGAGQTARRVG